LRRRLLLVTTLNSLGAVGLQIVALVTLEPIDYGLFTIPYLMAAFFCSLELSVVSDPWARMMREVGSRRPWPEYSTVTLYLSLVGSLATAILCVAIFPLREAAVAAAVAAFATIYRYGARYQSLHLKDWNYVLSSDLTVVVLTVVAGVFLVLIADPSAAHIFNAWMFISLGGAVSSRWPTPESPRVLRSWMHVHRSQIGPLLRDSLVMDVAAIGTPYALVPFLGIADFATYRALSNIGAPVRLLVNPLRAHIGAMSRPALREGSLAARIALLSIAMGAAGVLSLYILSVADWNLGTLNTLYEHLFVVGVYLAANFPALLLYVFSRQFASPSAITRARVAQTMAYVGLPIIGAWGWGISGAVWGYALATVVAIVAWANALRQS